MCRYKRVVTKVTFVGDTFTRKPPKYERFIRPAALRFKKAHVVHPELQVCMLGFVLVMARVIGFCVDCADFCCCLCCLFVLFVCLFVCLSVLFVR